MPGALCDRIVGSAPINASPPRHVKVSGTGPPCSRPHARMVPLGPGGGAGHHGDPVRRVGPAGTHRAGVAGSAEGTAAHHVLRLHRDRTGLEAVGGHQRGEHGARATHALRPVIGAGPDHGPDGGQGRGHLRHAHRPQPAELLAGRPGQGERPAQIAEFPGSDFPSTIHAAGTGDGKADVVWQGKLGAMWNVHSDGGWSAPAEITPQHLTKWGYPCTIVPAVTGERRLNLFWQGRDSRVQTIHRDPQQPTWTAPLALGQPSAARSVRCRSS